MNCLPCFQNKESSGGDGGGSNDNLPVAKPQDWAPPSPSPPPAREESVHKEEAPLVVAENDSCSTKNFTFRELAMATKNFRQEFLLGEGGFGRVFKGTLQGNGQVVAVRQLDRNGVQGSQEFVTEVANLNLLEHPNLVKLVGYCADGDQRLLVYEFMPKGSVKEHLFELPEGGKPLDWNTRMKIASGITEGLEYLHEKINPPIIYRDLKSSNILLDDANNPRLSKYGLANLVQSNNNMLHVAPRVMTSHGYCAPEYERNGELTAKSDVYSFGVVLLELISGRKAFDATRPEEEQNLVGWAQPIFRDQTKFPDIADPLLRKGYPLTSLNQAVGVVAMCLQEEPLARPFISDISAAVSFLAMAPPEAPIPDHLAPILSSRAYSGSQYSDSSSFREGNSSTRKQRHRQMSESDSEDESNVVSPDDCSNSSSDYEYSDSDNSDHEGVSKSAEESNESKKLSSSISKRKSKKEHRQGNPGRSISSRSRRGSCSSGSKLKNPRSSRCENRSVLDTSSGHNS